MCIYFAHVLLKGPDNGPTITVHQITPEVEIGLSDESDSRTNRTSLALTRLLHGPRLLVRGDRYNGCMLFFRGRTRHASSTSSGLSLRMGERSIVLLQNHVRLCCVDKNTHALQRIQQTLLSSVSSGLLFISCCDCQRNIIAQGLASCPLRPPWARRPTKK